MQKTILITGASSGFGRETTKLFQKNGWNVIASMRSPEKENELNKLNNVFVTQLDVTNKQSIQEAVNAGISQFGKIDILLNNAGYGAIGAIEAATDELIKQQFDVNLFGLIDVTKAVLPFMRQNKEGVIINISSMGGKITFPFGSLYHATKFAVEGLTEAMQYELNPLGIKLKLIEPGSYRTDFGNRSLAMFGIDGLEDYKPGFDKLTAFASTPDRGNKNINEVAEAIYEAATDRTDKLRYPVGADALQLIRAKEESGDIDFKKMMMSHIGL
ncbi:MULTISPECIES: SDR family oxidoreductase [Chryseobacterium]|uniref:SDR family oxidoreductase n=1 Tax=Chryseobacterium TaxID=59732 RepID=UPI001BE4E988|nr:MULTISPECIES: SDR family oxidoreductase [Chryseobacterium]MBT2619876.1 SDR family oxidoreductase [Chryseobacterium sp. ISL-6]